MPSMTLQQAIDLALQQHRSGRLPEAERLYRQILASEPNHPDALHLLGVVAYQTGRHDLAVNLIERSIAINPQYSEAYANLGNALANCGRHDEAIAAFQRAILFREDHPEAHIGLGNVLRAQGRLDESIAAHRRSIELRPDNPKAYCNLGDSMAHKGELDAAIAAYRAAIGLKPDYAEAYCGLSLLLRDSGSLDDAISACRRAIALKPQYPEAHNYLGCILKEAGWLDEAIAACRRAIELRPDFPEAHGNLAVFYCHHPDCDAQFIAEEQRRWNLRHAEPLRQAIGAHYNDRDPGRRLRLGYVSPDFRDHVVGRNLLPLFRRHDHQQFEVFCYSNLRCGDQTTREFQRLSDGWRDIAGLADERAAEKIREDGIDILVDLALQTNGGRLLIFARKPAPVQATFAGYPGSTGLTAIDYRLSDPWLDPPGIQESIYSEKTIRLPYSFWCYDPLDAADINVNLLPASKSGAVTFGCLNNICKTNDRVLSLWAQVLGQVSNSRLLLLATPGSHRQRMIRRLSEYGIDARRIEFAAPAPRRDYLRLYHRIDIGLDTFPYNGHTTSLDSFWMGVPVVTLVGQTAVSRAGWCQLSNLGLQELAGNSGEQFVKIAAELAGDLPRLAELRSMLRGKMQRSPLMDAAKFARNIESAYRQMWRTWCEKQ